MKKITEPTHFVEYSSPGAPELSGHAFGKSDLFDMVKDMLKDGVTSIKITVLTAPQR